MKRIEAIIRPHRLSEALAALAKMQVGVTVIDAMGFGRQAGHSEVYQELYRFDGTEVGLVPKKMIILFVEDAEVNKVVETISQIARTGYPGDGKVVVSGVDQIARVRTPE